MKKNLAQLKRYQAQSHNRSYYALTRGKPIKQFQAKKVSRTFKQLHNKLKRYFL